jgi:hypothetical protein
VKFLVGVLLVSPVWGWFSAQLFLQCCLPIVGAVCGLAGLVRGRVSRWQNLMIIGTCMFSVTLWSALLYGGFWLLFDVLEFGASGLETVIYWAVAVIFVLGSMSQVMGSLRRSWRFAMVPGAIHQFSIERQMQAVYRKAGILDVSQLPRHLQYPEPSPE